VDVGDFDQSGLFRNKEDITFEEEEIALNGFEVGFKTWVSISAREGSDYIFQLNQSGQTFGSSLNR
jgi:hypothetical protein